MRKMPASFVDRDTLRRVEVPSIPFDEWISLVVQMIGRPVTVDEAMRIERMGRHNWTARVVAEEIIGRRS